MKLILDDSTLTVHKEKGDPVIHRSNWAPDPNSTLLYHVKVRLNAMGFNVIKKRMWRDGHLVADAQQYVRSLPQSPGPRLAVFDANWAVRPAAWDFNETGTATFTVVADFFGDQPDCLERAAQLLKGENDAVSA